MSYLYTATEINTTFAAFSKKKNPNMTDNIEKKDTSLKGKEIVDGQRYGKTTQAWISISLAIAAWLSLFWLNGYVALGLAIVGAIIGFIGMPRRSAAVKRLAITAIIATIVLIVVVSSYLVVIKIGLS